jgi:PAS domain S-box-containing protein
MTRAELQQALEEQQAENAALRAELARCSPVSAIPLPNQEQLVQLMQELYTAVVLSDGCGLVTWVSPGFTTLCGLELPEVAGRRPESFLRPASDEAQTLDHLRANLRAKVPFQYEARNPRPGDEAGWIRVKMQPIYNERSNAVIMASLLEDITEWKKTQATLVESERRFQALAENVPGVLYEWRSNTDGTAHFSYVSPKLYELFGIVLADINHFLDFTHPDDAAALRQSVEHSRRTQTPWTYEGRVEVPGQPLRWVRGNSLITGHDAEGTKYSGILLDITPLKLAQAALRESDLRLRLAVEGFGDGAWEYNLRTRQFFFSADYKAMLGYDEFSNQYEDWLAHLHPEDREEALRTWARCQRGETRQVALEYRIRCQSGAYKWVLSRALVTEYDAAGQALLLTGIHTDISELKKAQVALNASTRRLSTVIANFQEGLVLEDENRHIVFTNDAFCRLLQVPSTPAYLVGKHGAWLAERCKGYLHQPDEYVARIAELLHHQKPAVGDVLALRDGRTLQRDFAPIYDRNRHIGHLWKYEDITARTKAEEDLKRREEKYRGIIENMSLGLVEADLHDRLLYANQSFCAMTGFCTEELMDRQLSSMMLTDDDLRLVESKRKARQRGLADSYEIAVTTKRGEVKWLLVSGAPLYGDGQQLIGSIGIYLDVTPHKELEVRLREAKGLAEVSTRAKQDFLANMSHEIRTPMNAILGMSQLLAKTALNGPQTSYLHAITSSAENLLVIINDILDLSKIEAGRVAIEKIGFRPGLVCAQVEKTLQHKAEEKGLSLLLHVGPVVPPVLVGDPYRITQILLNLAGNSVKFTERGTVTITCELVAPPAAGEAVIEFTVQDTGVGIEPTTWPRCSTISARKIPPLRASSAAPAWGWASAKTWWHCWAANCGLKARRTAAPPTGLRCACRWAPSKTCPRKMGTTSAACSTPCAANEFCSSKTTCSTACWPTPS